MIQFAVEDVVLDQTVKIEPPVDVVINQTFKIERETTVPMQASITPAQVMVVAFWTLLALGALIGATKKPS